MTLSVLFSNRDFTPRLQPSAEAVPTRLSWSSPGGPDTAVIALRRLRGDPWSAAGLLRCPVLIRDAWGRSAWWGYVSSLAFPTAGAGRAGPGYSVLDLEPMANQVKVAYLSARPGYPDVGLPATTGWQSLPESIALFGYKERIVRLGPVSAVQASQRQAIELADHGYPVASLQLTPSPLGEGRGEVPFPVLVFCRGWYATLGWRTYANLAGLEACDTLGLGVQALGDAIAHRRLAQSFSLPASWMVERVAVRVRKVGLPGDSLVIALHNDASGIPGALLTSEALSGPSIAASDMTYREVILPYPPALASGTTHWIVISRSGGADAANYYSLDVDESLSYPQGSLEIDNGAAWQPRAPDADLNFRLRGSQQTTDQISAMASTAAGGQFLSAVAIETPSGVYASQFRDGTRTALDEINRLLETGASSGQPLLAEVTPDRILRVYARPAPGAADWTVDAAGQVTNEAGVPQPAYLPPVGHWLRLKQPYPRLPFLSGDPGLAWIGQAEWKA